MAFGFSEKQRSSISGGSETSKHNYYTTQCYNPGHRIITWSGVVLRVKIDLLTIREQYKMGIFETGLLRKMGFKGRR
jgi:hypothetical protein